MLKYLLKEMRVHHYVKNLLVFAALVCSGKFFDAEKLMSATLIFAAFCFTSSRSVDSKTVRYSQLCP